MAAEDAMVAAKQARKEQLIGSTAETKFEFRRLGDKYHLLIGCTGSVASVKIPPLVQELCEVSRKHSNRLEVRIVATEMSLKFFEKSHLPDDLLLYVDSDEWDLWSVDGVVLHIALRRWADAMLLAPLDANTLGKIASGICDNLLTCVVRAWDSKKPLYFCPAMNTYMWNNPITYKQVEVLKSLFGFREIPCIVKNLACGDTGIGAMASVTMISSIMESLLKNHFAVITG